MTDRCGGGTRGQVTQQCDVSMKQGLALEETETDKPPLLQFTTSVSLSLLSVCKCVCGGMWV